MNATNSGQNFDIRLTSDMLRRDTQVAMGQFNRLSQQAVMQGKKIDQQFATMGNNLSGAISKGVEGAKSALADLSKNILGISALMASGAFIKDIYSSVGEFNKQMRIVSTISEDVSDNMEAYKKQVLDLCAEIAVAPETAAQALYQINSAGHLGADGMMVLEASAKAAVGGVTDVSTAADAITTILNAYHMSAEQAAAVSDKLFTTVRLGKTTMDELGRSIAYVAPLAATYKISIDEVLAAVAQLTKQGNSTQNAMTQISASIMAVANELGDDAFKDGLLPALEEIEKRSNGSNAALKAQLSNIRAVRGALGLTKENAAETAEMVQQIRNSAGATEDACKKMNTIAGAELTKLKNNFIAEFSQMASTGTSILGGLAKALNDAFATGHMQDFLNILGLIIAEYGIYKAITLTATTFQNAERTALLNAEYEAWMRLTPAKVASSNADVEAAMAAGILTEAKGQEIIALRAELAEKIANAAASKKLAADEVAAAEAALAAAEAKVVAAERAVAAKEAELVASGEICGAYMSEKAVKEMSIVTDNAKVAVTEKEVAVKGLATAQTKLDTAATELNVLSHQKNMIAQKVETASTTNLSLAKRILTAVTAKLNAVIAANPFLVAAAAITALCVGVYKLITYESTAEKQTKAMHKAVAAATQEYAREEAKLKQLNDTLKANKKGSEEWKKAKDAIIKQYGKYHSGLDAEIDKVGYLKDSYEELTKAIKKSILARQMQTYAEENMPDASALMGEILNLYGDRPLVPNWDRQEGEDAMVHLVTDQKGMEDFADKMTKYIMGENVQWTKAQKSFLEFRGGALAHQKYIVKLLNKRNEMQSYQNNAAILQKTWGDFDFGLGDDDESKLQTDADGNPILNKAYWEKQRDDAQAALDKMDSTLLATQEALDLKKKITDANKQIAKYDTKAKRGHGGGSGKTQAELNADYAQSQQEEADLIAQQARERARQEQDAQFEADQVAIDAMEDGAQKRLKQRQLDYEKQKAEIQREMEDAIITEIEYQKAVFDAAEDVAEKQAAAAGNKNYAKRTFNPGNLLYTHDLGGNNNYDFQTQFAQEQIGDVATANINAIIQRYRALATGIADAKTNELMRAAVQSSDEFFKEFGTYLQKRQAMINIANREADAAATQGERNSILARLNADLEQLDFEQFMTEKSALAFGNIEQLSQQTISELIDDLENYRSKIVKTFDPTQISRYDEALRKLKKAQALNDNNLMAGFIPREIREQKAMQDELNTATAQYNSLVEEQAKKEQEVNDLIQQILEKVRELTGMDYTEADILDPAKFQQIQATLQETNADGAMQVQGLADQLGVAQSELGGITEAAGAAGQAIAGMGEAGGGPMATLEVVGAIVHAINDNVQAAAALMRDLANTADALGADTEVGSGWDTATTIMDGFAEASEGATQAFESFKSGNPMGVIQGVVQSFTAWIRTFAAIHDAKHERRIQELQLQIEELEDAYHRLDRAISKAFSNDASRLLNQQAEMIEQEIQLIKLQIEEEKAKKNSDEDKIREWERTIKDLEEDYEDAKEAAIDAIFGEDIQTAIENFADAYQSMFDDGITKAKASKDLVKDMIKQMIIEAMKADISQPMEQLRQMMLGFWENDGKISEWEQEQLNKFAENLMTDLENQYSWADGYFKGGNTQGGGSKGGFTTMSQDSADELNGRFTALQMAGEAIKVSVEDINDSLRQIVARNLGMSSHMEEIRGLALIAVDHLESIRKNTANLSEMNERLEKIEKYTSRL